MRSIVDRNVVMRRMAVLQQFGTAGMVTRAAILHAVSILSCVYSENKDAVSDAARSCEGTRGNLHKGGCFSLHYKLHKHKTSNVRIT
jgi:hypothetical protein